MNIRSGRSARQAQRATKGGGMGRPYIVRNIPTYDVMSEENLLRIEGTADRILAEVGIEFRDDAVALDHWRKAGADVQGLLVKFPPGMLREVLKTAPAQFMQHARNPAQSIVIGGKSVVFSPAYGSPFVMDLDRGRRFGTLEDFQNFIKLAQSSPHFHHSGGTICEPTDIPVNKRHLDMVMAHITCSDRAFMGSVTSESRAEDSIDMQSHEMVLHRDYNAFMREIFNPAAAPPPDHDCLCERNQPDDPAWKNLGVAALMTIAFPVALAPRYIDRPFTDYEYRFAFPFAPEGVSYAPPLNPDKTTGYHAAAIDGGLVDNEPFGLAHDVLAGTEGHNARQGALAKRAIVLIDPFPNLGPTGSNKEPLPLLGLFGKIWNALILQNRFKPIDITLAASDTVYSRFMIAPVRRTVEKTVRGNWALASHPLNSFFGYFSGHYRHHDFMLGRHNCHAFLRDWFVLPSEQPVAQGEAVPGNTLFAQWPKPAMQNQDYFSTSQLRPGHRQIIPLTGTAANAPQKPEWPRAKFSGYGEIAEKAEKRLRKIAPQLLAQVADAVAGSGVTRWLVYLALKLWWWFSGRRNILRLLQSSVEAATAAIDNDAGAERSPKTAARVAVAATARAPDT